jgi:protein gp37
MAQTTEIAWCDSTFNPWIGCTKVSPGCAHCYAERDFDLRKHVAKWGAGQPRHRTSAAYWRQPLKWDQEAATRELYHEDETNLGKDLGVYQRPRVFCASLADWLDDEVPIEWLADLLVLIRRTPHLDWLLLTKRPQNFLPRLQQIANERVPHWPPSTRFPKISNFAAAWIGQFGDGPMIPANVWIGTSIEDHARADERISALLSIPARVRFLSCEPLLGPVDLRFWDGRGNGSTRRSEGIHWVICGGESGPHPRPMHPAWARSLRNQCQAAAVPFFFKQWGEWSDTADCGKPGWSSPDAYLNFEGHVVDEATARKGGSWKGIWRVGKSAAGRLLDGREHNEFPS